MKSRLSIIYIIAVCFSVLIITHVYSFVRQPASPPEAVKLEIEPGSSAWEISKKLQEHGIISDYATFMVVAVVTGKFSHLQAGTYVFEGVHYPLDIMGILFQGKTLRYKITVPEGSDIFDIADIVAATGLISKETFIHIATSKDSAQFFGIEAPSLEGYLYPDTYFLAANMTPLEIMAKMINRFKHIYALEIQQKYQNPDFSLLEIITLASIIEKEAAKPDEKPIISSVFHNRLKKNMKLQSDPTAIYGIDNFDRDILHKDLERDSPYNTYRYKGLPPGPICNPGKDSIAAAIRPKQTSYLYFVSKGDRTHAFSKTLREHNRVILIYRKKPDKR